MPELPNLKVGTGWIELEIILEPTVILTFRGYAPVVAVRDLSTKLDYWLFIGAKSMAKGLEPMRERNKEKFTGLRFRIKKESTDQMAAYVIEEIA